MSIRTRLDPFSGERYVSAADLTPEQKRRVWAHVREHDPNYAVFLTDAEVSKWIKEHGATPRFSPASVREALGE